MEEQLFVERRLELEQLARHLEQALSGHGQICFITGEAGSGKTALIRHFVEQALTTDSDLVVALGNCNAQTGIGDPYLPFREVLAVLTGTGSPQTSAAGFTPGNNSRLRTMLVHSVQVLVEVAPQLVGLFVPGGSLLATVGKVVADKVGWMDQLALLAKKPVALAAEQSRIFEQYTAFLQRLSAKVPLILILDDLQWADNASLGLLFHLGRRIESSRILILGAYRPDDVALGRDGERHPLEPVVHELTRYHGDVSIDLDAIPEVLSRRFVDALLDSEPNHLGEAFRAALYHQTGGHALFTVELIRDMQERGDLVRDGNGHWVEGDSLEWGALPAKVEGVIAERIARLDEALQEMLTIGSVEGEVFRAEVIAQVQAMTDREAILCLSNELQREHHLVSALGLVQFAALRLSLYRFVHNLFQQYLYSNLDEVQRAYLHQDVGQALEALFGNQSEEVAAQLARHFEEAGLPAKAASYRLQAGNKAYRMSAHQEAVTHLRRGLDLLVRLPEGPERLQLELGLQTSLGRALIATNGYGSAQVEQAFGRARELCRALGDPPQVIPVLYGLAMFGLVRAQLSPAQEEGEQLLLLAQRAGDAGYVLGCHVLLGVAAMYLGKLAQARSHLEQAIALYDFGRHRDLAYQQGQDPCVAALAYLSRVLWLQGYPDQATSTQMAALRMATQVSHPYSLGLAVTFTAILHAIMGRWTECRTQAEEAMQHASLKHFPLWQATAAMSHGAAMMHDEQVEQGISELCEGLVAYEATGTRLALPYFRARLAEAYLLAGRREEGLGALAESLRGEEETWWLHEQHRLRAELLLVTPGHEAEAEDSLYQALELARAQEARSLELRAAMSLARLLRRQERRAEGRDLLEECYAWFTEGFDTADLQEAKELLEVLELDGQQASATKDDHYGGNSEAFIPRPPRVASQSCPVGVRS